MTIRNGRADRGGGIFNAGTLTIYGAIISGNSASFGFPLPHSGGGIFNSGMLTITYSTVSGNSAVDAQVGTGGGIDNSGVMMISNTSITGNAAWSGRTILNHFGQGVGGGIFNQGTLTISNSTLAGNGAGPSRSYGGAIANSGTATISNSTVAGNTAYGTGGGISTYSNVTLQNTIVANNSGGNCNNGTIKSIGYNLSSDQTCDFRGTGDLNNVDPKLGTLGYYGGPTQTIPLLAGSPAIDAGNPTGCTDGQGNPLTTDQRGMPRPDPGDAGGCDMGAYESQSN